MRITHICEEMNVTGCTEWHNHVDKLTGIRWFLHNYQIESAFIMAFVFIILLITGIVLYNKSKFAKRGKNDE
jgi:glucose uptake protein GlcU